MTHTVYTDNEGTQMEVYANDKGKLFIGIGDKTDSYYYQCIALNECDAIFLAKDIQRIIDEYDLNNDGKDK